MRLHKAASALILAYWLITVLACGQVITVPTPTPLGEAAASPRPTSTATATLPPTPAPVTPAPTFTPTPSPTPIIYTVQPGDTLIGISKKFGVSVQIIQEANAIADPRSLRAGQTLLIPQGVEAMEGTPTPTPTPIPFEVSGLNFYQVPGGALWCLGEVVNTADIPIEQVAVLVKLYNSAGSLLAQSTAFTALDVIPPGGKGSFVAEFAEPPGRFDRYEVVPFSAVPAHSPSRLYNSFIVKEHSWNKTEYDFYRVQGIVVNAGDAIATEVNVVVTAYDALGKVVALKQAVPAKSTLHPFEESKFYITFAPAGNPPVTYTLQVQGIASP